MQDYRKLHVWRKAHALALNVRQCTMRFPRAGFGELKLQITSSAESIPSNIVEGCGAFSRKEFARFLAISIKSANEMEYQLLLVRDNSILNPTAWESLTSQTIEVRKMLCSLRAKVLESESDHKV